MKKNKKEFFLFFIICLNLTNIYSQEKVSIYPATHDQIFRGRNIDLSSFDANIIGLSLTWPIKSQLNPRASFYFDNRNVLLLENLFPLYRHNDLSFYAILGIGSTLDFNEAAPITGIGSIYHFSKRAHFLVDLIFPVTDDLYNGTIKIIVRGGIGYSF